MTNSLLKRALIPLLAFVLFGSGASPQAWSTTLFQDAYVWQRSWTAPVRQAVQEHGPDFSRLVVLKAEVTWQATRPQIATVAIDYPTLAATRRPVGIAVRIGPYAGPFTTNAPATKFLAGLAESAIAEAKRHRLAIAELQLDFDCAESKLEGYRVWIQAIRARIAPVPLTITVLPSWLRQPAFGSLVSATDGYVLQVHSFERPRNAREPFTLCDPAAARQAVERAVAFKVPFRVALPTYGYRIAFDSVGRFVGLSAEGPARSWPEGVQEREVRADPVELARLAQYWATNRPPAMRGLIWYRLLISTDILNWRWPTLSAIVALRSPHESVRAESRRVEPGLVEISLVNNGELDISSRLAVEVRWSRESGARLLAADGLRGFEMVDERTSTLRLQNQSQSCRLPAGERQVIGWLRFNQDREVQVELKQLLPQKDPKEDHPTSDESRHSYLPAEPRPPIPRIPKTTLPTRPATAEASVAGVPFLGQSVFSVG